VVAVLPLPGSEPVTSICFGGKDFNTLYVLSGGKIYKRKLHSMGAPPWNPAIELPKWGAG
jgi:sugar lactone lactonase YvrE